MNSFEHQFGKIVKLLNEAKIEYAIIGGLAVSLYGEPRATFDIDISILLADEDIDRFLKKAGGYKLFSPFRGIKAFIKKTGVAPLEFSEDYAISRCDFIIAKNSLEFATIKRANVKKLFSTKVRLITAEDLLIHKITSSRPRDLDDAQGILIRQRKKLDFKYINQWLKKIAEANNDQHLIAKWKKLLK